jgi:hypothetical protein
MDTTLFTQTLHMKAADVRAGNSLSGKELGLLLTEITSLEIQEGGPYAISEPEQESESLTKALSKELNAAIADFLDAHGIQLPNLDAYLRENNMSVPDLNHSMGQDDMSTDKRIGKKKEEENDHETKMIEAIREASRQRCKALPKEMQEQAESLLNSTLAGNPDRQMPLMPYFFRESLGSLGTQFDDDYIVQLGLANVYFWTAFILYDDLWDFDEAGDPAQLPIANLFARHFIEFFVAALPDSEFRAFFRECMDTLDAANRWETQSCRTKVENVLLHIPEKLPDFVADNTPYALKYYPVAGHTMGAVTMLLQLGYSLESDELQYLLEYFKQYLIAMQINDDLHDWKEDLLRGHLSTVVVEIIRAWKERYPNAKEIHLVSDMSELEELFWFEILVPRCNAILFHAQQSRSALEKLTFLENIESLERFILKNEEAARKAIAERQWSQEFLKAVDKGLKVTKT